MTSTDQRPTAGGDKPPSDMQYLMALIGNLLVRWGWLEQRLNGQRRPAEVDEVREIRNTICHGIVSAHANPWSAEEAYIRCRTNKGEEVVYRASQLEEAIRTLERLGGHI